MSGMTKRDTLAAGLGWVTAGGSAIAAPAPLAPEARLKELGIVLPPPPQPAGGYAPWRRSKRVAYISGMIPPRGEGAVLGRVGLEVTLEQARHAARLCGLNALAVLRQAAGGSLDRVAQCLKVTVFVASAPNFHEQPKVADGVSELFKEVFGEAGLHARAAVGAASLPFNAPVEVESIWELR